MRFIIIIAKLHSVIYPAHQFDPQILENMPGFITEGAVNRFKNSVALVAHAYKCLLSFREGKLR